MKVLCFSVTPSPYQRDFFSALAAEPGCELQVQYFESAADDSPWAEAELQPWERVMPGRVFGKGRVRCHWHGTVPSVRHFDRVIVNAPLTGLTTQRVFRRLMSSIAPPWVFWGEQLLPRTGWRGVAQKALADGVGNADAIVAIGSAAAEDYRRRFPSVPVHDIPYSCDLRGFEDAGSRRVPGSGCRFLFAGQMIERKGVDVLLKAFSQLCSEGLDVSLQLVGREGELPGWLEKLPEQVRGRIPYHGFKQPAELPAVFGGADVFVLPSRHDGWGVVVNQALGAAMPVISSRAAGAGRDLVTDGVEGIHVNPGDVDGLAAAMRRLATDTELRERMAAAAAERSRPIRPVESARRWVSLLKSIGNQVSK